MRGSAGVLIRRSYLERIAAICRKHGVLLIFDEVITGFSASVRRLPRICSIHAGPAHVRQAINNAAVPMGAVIAKNEIYETITQAAQKARSSSCTATPTRRTARLCRTAGHAEALRRRTAVRARAPRWRRSSRRRASLKARGT
jgi:glutamate-1-semialdehyde aminotransferase